MFKKFKNILFLIALIVLVLPFAACSSPYDSIKISISTSISALDSENSVTLKRELATSDNEGVNQFTVSATVSAKKGVPTDLTVSSSKPDVVKILNIEQIGNRTIAYCEADESGEAQIKFVSFGGKSETIRVNVDEPLRSISIEPGYVPFAYVGRSVQFDVSKIRFNNVPGAVEPSVENKQIQFSTRNSAVSVSSTGYITVSPNFVGSSFVLRIDANNNANTSVYHEMTIRVISQNQITTANVNVENNGLTTITPKFQKNLRNGIVDVDLALFPTDVDFKSAKIEIENYRISNLTNLPNTKFSFKEVGYLGGSVGFTSGAISLTTNEFNSAELVLTAESTVSENAYVNVYAYLEGYENSTSILVARIHIIIKNMPNDIVLKQSKNGDEIEKDRNDGVYNIDIYNELKTVPYQKIYPYVYAGRSQIETAKVFVSINDELARVLNIIGAEKVNGVNERYLVTDLDNFGFSIKDGVTLAELESIAQKTISFYAAHEFSFESDFTSETIVFGRTNIDLRLNLKLSVDAVEFWQGNSEETKSKTLNLNAIINSGVTGYEQQIVVNFKTYLNGQEVSEFTDGAVDFVTDELSEIEQNNLFYIDFVKKQIIITPSDSIAKLVKLKVEGFGINPLENYVQVNFYAKPVDVQFDILNSQNISETNAYNMQVNSTQIGYFKALKDSDNELLLADLKIAELMGKNTNPQVWQPEVVGKNIIFNATGLKSGKYVFDAKVVDAGGNPFNKTFAINVYVPIYSNGFYVKVSEGSIPADNNTGKVLTDGQDVLYTTSSVNYLDLEKYTKRTYTLFIAGLNALTLDDFEANGISVDFNFSGLDSSFYTISRHENSQSRTITSQTQTGTIALTIVVKQNGNLVGEVAINIEIVDAPMVKSLSNYNDLPFIGINEGYGLYKNIDSNSGLIEPFNVTFDGKIFDGALNKNLGYLLNEKAKNLVDITDGKVIFKTKNNKNVIGDGYLYVYALDSVSGVVNEGNISSIAKNFIKIHIIVADGDTIPYVVYTEQQLFDMADGANYQLQSNIKINGVREPIALFSRASSYTFNGNGFVIYNVDVGSGNTLFASNSKIENLYISYADGKTQNYNSDSTAKSSFALVGRKESEGNFVVDFSPNEPIDLKSLFNFYNTNGTLVNNPDVSFEVTYNGVTEKGVVVDNVAVITRSGSGTIIVKGGSNGNVEFTVTFNFVGIIPGIRSNFNYSVRKNHTVNLEPTQVSSPYTTVLECVAFSGNLENGEKLQDIYTLDASGRFRPTKVGTYTIIEHIVQSGFGDVLTNRIYVNVFEGATNISASIVNGSVIESTNRAELAPFETLAVRITVTTDNKNEQAPTLTITNGEQDFYFSGSNVESPYYNVSHIDEGSVNTATQNVYYKSYTYYIRVKDGVQSDFLRKQIGLVFAIDDDTTPENVSTTVVVYYINSLPNYVDFYNVNENVDIVTSVTDKTQFMVSDATNELIPEFGVDGNVIGGYQTFILDVFPQYTANKENNLKITLEAVNKLKNSNDEPNEPMPKYYNYENRKYEYLTETGVEIKQKEFLFNGESKNYYVLPIYMPLVDENGYRAQLGDKYSFNFKVEIEGTNQYFKFEKVLEIVYPLYLEGSFYNVIDDATSESITQKRSGNNISDTVAVGTEFAVKLNVTTPQDVQGKLEFTFVSSNGSLITYNREEQLEDNAFMFYFSLGNITDFSRPVYLSFRVTKTLDSSNKKLSSNLINFEVRPVQYKIASLDIFENGVQLKNNEALQVTAQHALRVGVNAIYDRSDENTNKSTIETKIKELEDFLNDIDDPTYKFTHLGFYAPSVNPGVDPDEFKELKFNVANPLKWEDTDYLFAIKYDANTPNDYAVVFSLPNNSSNSLTLNTKATFAFDEEGYYKIQTNETQGYFESFNKDLTINLYLSSYDDAPHPVSTFEELKNYISTSAEDDDQFANVNLILTDDIYVSETAIEGIVGSGSIFAANFASLDGNNYSIKLSSKALDALARNAISLDSDQQTSSEINANVGFFTSVGKNTIIKNLKIELTGLNNWLFSPLVDASENTHINLNFGLLTGVNNGIITNCSVVTGANVTMASIYPYPVKVTTEIQANVNATIGGLVGLNNGYITNSRVLSPINVGGAYSEDYQNYTSNGNFTIGGFVGNNTSKIASSKFELSVNDSSIGIKNYAVNRTENYTAGFVAINSGDVMYCYAEGYIADENLRSINQIYSNSIVAGFVYKNTGAINDCYSNFTLIGSIGVAGFVEQNGEKDNNEVNLNSTIENALSFSEIVEHSKLGYRPFTGTTVNTAAQSQESNNFGTIYNSYYLYYGIDTSAEQVGEVPSLNLNEITNSATLSGFAFNSQDDRSSIGIWKMALLEDMGYYKPTLVSANHIVTAQRSYEFTQNAGTENEYNVYSWSADAPYGSDNNPIIVYNAESFNKISDPNNNSASLRLICDIEFDSSENRIKTTETTFYGRLDGNGMQISNLYINLEEQSRYSVGMFANLTGKSNIKKDDSVDDKDIDKNPDNTNLNNANVISTAEVKALNIDVSELYASQVSNVGVVAGIVSDANIFNVNLTSSNGAVIHGKNAVGGIAGIVLGKSQIFNCISSVDVLSTYAGTSTTINEIGMSGATSTLLKLDEDENLKQLDEPTFENIINAIGTKFTKDSSDITNEAFAAKLISNAVSTNSFAGGIIGVYNGGRIDAVVPMLSLLHAENTRVEGGVAGGVIGAIANECLAVDLKYNTDLTTGRIIGRIAAGGVVGENHGTIMFGRSEHTEEVQREIDKVENEQVVNLFNSEVYNTQLFGTQKVYAVGGLVGINIEGSIIESYSRLYINNLNASNAGGVVGVINGGSISNVYTTSSVYGKDAAGGIVGYMHGEPDKNETSKVSMSGVLALNAYSSQHVDLLLNRTYYGSLVGKISKNFVSLKDENGTITNQYIYPNLSNGYLTLNQADLNKDFKDKYSDNNKNTNWVISRLFKNGEVVKNEEDKEIQILTFKVEEPDNKTGIDIPEATEDASIVKAITKWESESENDNDLTITNSVIAFKDTADIRKNRDILYSAMYYDLNNVWETQTQALLNKNPFPQLVNLKNYFGSTIEISNETEFIDFINNFNKNSTSATYTKCTLVFTNNINISEVVEDLPSTTTLINKGTFAGTIKGNNHTIKLGNHGLFNEVSGAVIEDLTIESAVSLNGNYGAFANNVSGSTFRNCSVDVEVKTSIQNANVGGFVGVGNGVTFYDCTSTLTVEENISIKNSNIGGFVGTGSASLNIYGGVTNFGVLNSSVENGEVVNIGGFIGSGEKINIANSLNDDTSITNSIVTANINLSASATVNLGGAVGAASGGTITGVEVIDSSSIELENATNAGLIGGATAGVSYVDCKVAGTLNSSGSLGSISAQALNVTNSYSTASITAGNSATNVGGLVGLLDGTMSGCFFNGEISGNGQVAGLVYETNASANINQCFVATCDVAGSDASGLVYFNNGTVENCYSTATVKGSNSAGLIYNNQGTLSYSYFAGRNMSGNKNPIYSDNSGTINDNVYYCSNFGITGNTTSGGKSINEMLNEKLNALAFTRYTQEGTENEISSFPLINLGIVEYGEYRTAQLENNNIVPTLINDLNEITNETGFYVLASNTSISSTYNGTFKGILCAFNTNEIETSVPLFSSIENATIFGINLKGTIPSGNGAIANNATNSEIEKCSFNGSITGTGTIGGLVGTATDVAFSYSYVGESAVIDGTNGTVGGLAGSASGSFNSCFFAGTIKNASSMAGIYNTGSASINNCYVSGNLLDASGTASIFTTSTTASINNSFSIAYIQSNPQTVTIDAIKTLFESFTDKSAWFESNGDHVFPYLKNITGGQDLGTRIYPHKITREDDLQNIAEHSSDSYILMKGINWTGFEYVEGRDENSITYMHFEPIKDFGGTIFGQDNNINNLLVTNKPKNNSASNAIRENSPLGFIANTKGNAYLFNINLVNADMYASNVTQGAGFMVGSVDTGSTAYIINCSVDNNSKLFAAKYKTVSSSSDDNLVGYNKLIGNASNENCVLTGSNIGTDAYYEINQNNGNVPTEGANIEPITISLGQDDAYHIYNPGDFIWWVENGDKTKTAKLERDINLANYKFANNNDELISVLGEFSGIIDGQFHTISNLYCLNFVSENKGIIKNLNLFNAYVEGTTSNSNIGIIAETNSGTILNCLASGFAGNRRGNSAGIAGHNTRTIANSFGSACDNGVSVLPDYR